MGTMRHRIMRHEGPFPRSCPQSWGACASGNREGVARASTLKTIGKYRKEKNLSYPNTQIYVTVSILVCFLSLFVQVYLLLVFK